MRGGGRVAWVVAGPEVKKAYVSTTLYQHQSTLRFLSEALGIHPRSLVLPPPPPTWRSSSLATEGASWLVTNQICGLRR